MTVEPVITVNSLGKLLVAGYSVYRIPPAYKRAIHYLKVGKWGPVWETFKKFDNANEAETELNQLLRDDKNLQVK